MYGTRAPLDAGIYYNLLYQEGIRRELLDFLGNQYNFVPGATVLALHEGEAIDRVNRDIDWNYSVSREMTQEIGDIYVLVFAAVALRQFEQYSHRTPYLEEVRGFLESLRQDGYRYENGHIYDENGAAVVPVPLGGTVGVRQPEAGPEEHPTPVPAPTPEPALALNKNKEIETTLDASAKANWSRGDKIAFWSLLAVVVIGVATLIATVASPEVRRFLHLDKPSPAASESKPLSPAVQMDKNQNVRPSSASPQPTLPTGPAEKTGIRDNVTVVVHRASPQSGAHTAMVATTGNGEQEINFGAAPTRLMFTPPGLVVDKRELPKKFEVSGQMLTVVRYTNSGVVIDDHKHSDVHFTVYMVEGNPAKQ